MYAPQPVLYAPTPYDVENPRAWPSGRDADREPQSDDNSRKRVIVIDFGGSADDDADADTAADRDSGGVDIG
jgi:hypothetical protein